MKTLTTVVAACVAVFGMAGTTAATASGEAYGSSVLISNPTYDDITYQIHWGDYSWKRFTIPARTTNWHFVQAADGQERRVSIKFDYIQNDGEVTFKEYNMAAKWTAASDRDGRPYAFKKIALEMIDLFDD